MNIIQKSDLLEFLKTLNEVKTDAVSLIIIQELIELLKTSDFIKMIHTAQAHLDYVWEKLNTGHWSQVDLIWRQLFSIISVVKILAILHLSSDSNNKDLIKDLVKICDVGLLMGAPILNNVCSRLATHFCNQLKADQVLKINEFAAKKAKLSEESDVQNVVKLQEYSQLSLEKFIKLKGEKVPFKITNSINDWPALEDQKWSMDFFKFHHGYRTVPIEIGQRYTDDSWTQNLMTIEDFIKNYIENPDAKFKGYLAQHELFQQIPELTQDFEPPIYCYTNSEDEDIATNIWLGPKGTISPLHTDPKHNCLCQVFGTKYVRLYAEDQTDFVYPFESQDIFSNTSQIDVEQDFEEITRKFPDFEKAQGFETILYPGDILYIPPKCWHFVKSLSQSCSLSFWF